MCSDYEINFPNLSGRRKTLHAAMKAIQEYEKKLSLTLISGLEGIPGVEVRGICDVNSLSRRVPSVSFTVKNKNPKKIAMKLAEHNIFVWHGHNYAIEAIRHMK